ncbi:hypothetical protein EB159_03575, partial [archaeon]|nr:hypothetical protein [archaeon]
MKIIFKTILVSLILSTGAVAETFIEALQKAFKNNSELNAERENLNVSEEDLKVSRSNYLPSVTLSGSKSQVDTNKLTNQSGGNAAISDTDPTTKSLTITQTLVDFGRGADYEKKTIGIDVAKAKLLKKEQDILYSTVEAYTGLILANEKLNINRANVNLLERQVETDQIKLERGQNTLSDVAQSESSLAGARAKLIQAENDFLTSKLNYENIIGPLSDPKTLEKKSIFDVNLPADLNSAINKSKLTNPDLIIAQLEYEQSTKDTYEAKSDHSFTHKDREEIFTTTWCFLTHSDGQFDPRKRHIHFPEPHFDIPIEEDWAKFEYEINGKKLKGQLAIKGTIDLVTKINDDTIEVIDWKTGRRMDWATGEVKDYKKLENDAQLLLYYYAISKLYPDFPNRIMSIFFYKDKDG